MMNLKKKDQPGQIKTWFNPFLGIQISTYLRKFATGWAGPFPQVSLITREQENPWEEIVKIKSP